MARIRTIKPEFWTNEKLCQFSEGTHLFAAALLNHADDEGFFNAHPGLLRASIYALREPSESVPGMLLELSSVGYLTAWNGSDGRIYGEITNFLRHQKISKPTKSKIKPLCSTPGAFPESSGSPPGVLPVGKERNREQGKEEEGNGECEGGSHEEPPAPADAGPSPADLQEAWNASSPPLPTWKELTPSRVAAAKLRLKERGLDVLLDAITRVAASPFCCGVNGQKWRATPDWFLAPKNLVKILEGNYDRPDRRGPPPPPAPTLPPAPPPSSKSTWGRAAALLAMKLDADQVAAWLDPVRELGVDGDTLRLGVPNLFIRDHLLDNHGDALLAAVAQAAGRVLAVSWGLYAGAT